MNQGDPRAVAPPKAQLPVTEAPAFKRYVEFFNAGDPLVLPHRNQITGRTLDSFNVACDGCGTDLPERLVHGTINDYDLHTEVRFVGVCPGCGRLLHNTARYAVNDELMFQKDGKWLITVGPWWKRLLIFLGILAKS